MFVTGNITFWRFLLLSLNNRQPAYKSGYEGICTDWIFWIISRTSMQPTRKEIMGHECAVRLGEKVICWKRETFPANYRYKLELILYINNTIYFASQDLIFCSVSGIKSALGLPQLVVLWLCYFFCYHWQAPFQAS